MSGGQSGEWRGMRQPNSPVRDTFDWHFLTPDSVKVVRYSFRTQWRIMPMSRRLRCRSFSVLSGLFLIGLACLSMADSDGEAPVTFVAPGAADGDLFGISVAVDRGRLAVGASSTDLERDDMGVV
ncbi:MAG: hypothetical protein ACOCSR_04830, partial [Wenzhouxiangella sp.]